jgi:hypothetical protein
MHAFDWYAATIRDDPGAILAGLRGGLEAEVQPGRGLHSYRRGVEFHRRGEVVARLIWDSGREDMPPHAWASGSDAVEFAEVVRRGWPDSHYVTRVDSAGDFDEPGAWERLYGAASRVREDAGVRGSLILPDDVREGRTYYVGSPKSDVRVRVYEKGAQVMGLQAIEAEMENPLADWVRVELQLRPGRVARDAVARMGPDEVWGCSPWARSLAREVAGMNVMRFKMQEKRMSSDERAYQYMLLQYGGVIERMAAECGDFPTWGRQVEYDLSKLKSERMRAA